MASGHAKSNLHFRTGWKTNSATGGAIFSSLISWQNTIEYALGLSFDVLVDICLEREVVIGQGFDEVASIVHGIKRGSGRLSGSLRSNSAGRRLVGYSAGFAAT